MCPNSDQQVIKSKDLDVEAGSPGEGKCCKPSRSKAPSSARRGDSLRTVCSLFITVMVPLALVAGFLALVAYWFGPQFVLQLGLVVLVAYLVSSGGFKYLYIVIVTTPRDVRALFNYIKILRHSRNWSRSNKNVATHFSQLAKKKPDKPCLYFEEQMWTRKEVDEYANKVANYFKTQGLSKGDCVALLMPNKPEFVCIWLGLSKLGVITALINNNLRLKSLTHCVNISKAKALIFDDSLTSAIKEICGDLTGVRDLYSWSAGESVSPESERCGAKQLKPLLAEASVEPPQVEDLPGFNDKLLYIYTSGTTGLPKAAVITNCRYMALCTSSYTMVGINSSDTIYTSLPLYHTAGGCLGVGMAVIVGGATVIRSKFSASNYFPDIIKYNCTVAQYIGEMCRYLLATPPKPEVEKNHKIRIILGNGLRPQIWREFTERFNIPQVGEFYGATEGNANIINVDNREGAIGFISRIIPAVYPISIIKVDGDTGEPIRNSKGLCQICNPGEPGAFIGKIVPSNPMRAFLGYVDEKDSEKKIVRNVFKMGDQAFISGDILEYDDYGYLYFKDRTGDTFRWKGENVSTSEIEAVISNILDYRDCVVYGVEVCNSEGRAGMAAVVDTDGTLDLSVLADGLKKFLPIYARPLFVRVMTNMEMTGTFKMKKLDLQKDGYDPTKVKDKLYYLAPNSTYEPLDNEVYSKIESGKIRL